MAALRRPYEWQLVLSRHSEKANPMGFDPIATVSPEASNHVVAADNFAGVVIIVAHAGCTDFTTGNCIKFGRFNKSHNSFLQRNRSKAVDPSDSSRETTSLRISFPSRPTPASASKFMPVASSACFP